jgi:hypothetical protein
MNVVKTVQKLEGIHFILVCGLGADPVKVVRQNWRAKGGKNLGACEFDLLYNFVALLDLNGRRGHLLLLKATC